MIALRPFFLLAGRASVFWMGAIGLIAAGLTVTGLAQPDERLNLYFDAVFIAAFVFPAGAGWLAGTVIQEFQHTTFAAVLPGVRSRVASGFLVAGLAVTMVVMTSIAMTSSSPQNLPMLFVVGLGAYCFGGIFLDPLSAWVSSVNVVLALYVIARSQEVARIAHDHPWITVAVFLGIGAASCFRLFARSTFRRKPLRATSLLPGRFSLEKSGEFERKRRIHDGPRRTGWRAGYLGSDPWRWVRAAVHEAYGSLGLKSLSRAIGRAWGLGLLLLIYAWADKGEMSFGEALAKSIYDALFRSPHVPEFGEEGGPYFVVALAIAAAGVVTVLYRPVALNRVIAYPLSRSQRTRVHFRGGLVDGAIFLFIVGPCLFAIGLLTGWVVGYEPRFDFMPFFLRVLMITVILMPLAHVGRLQLQAATRRRAENTMLGVIFGVVGFVVAVFLLTIIWPAIFVSPIVELVTLSVALLISQLLYRHKLTTHYQTADLA